MNTLQMSPPHLSDVATLPWEIQKKLFSILFFIYFRLFKLPQKKTNNNCCTAALDVYLGLLLYSASYNLHCRVLRLGLATVGARVLIRTC